MRTLIDLPEKLLSEIDSVARRDDISRAEAVRRAVADYVARKSAPRSDAAFGIWKSRHIESREYEDSLRDEWRR